MELEKMFSTFPLKEINKLLRNKEIPGLYYNNYFLDTTSIIKSDKNHLQVFATFLNGYFVCPDHITHIDNFCFSDSNIEYIKLPPSLEEIGESAFVNSKIKEISITNKCETIKQKTFYNCGDLHSVKLKNIKTIKSSSFANCYSLHNITLPDELLYIGEKCFLNCVSLNNIKIPKNVYLINESAFENCPIDTLFIPSSVNAIGINAFKGIKNVVFEERKEFMYETFGCSNISFLN